MPVLPTATPPRLILGRRLRPLLRRVRREALESPRLDKIRARVAPRRVDELSPPKAIPGRQVIGEVRGVTLGTDHRLEVSGWAFRRRSDGVNPTAITLVAVGPDGTAPLSFAARLVPDEEVNRSDIDVTSDRSPSSFVARLDPAALAAAGPPEDHRWRIEVRIEDSSGVHQEPFGGMAQFGTAGAAPTVSVGPRRRSVGVVQASGEGLVLAVRQPDVWVRDLDLSPHRLRVDIGHSARFWPIQADLVQRPEARIKAVRPPGTARLPLRLARVRGVLDLDLERFRDQDERTVQSRWTIELRDLAGRRRMLRWDAPSAGSAAPAEAEPAAPGLRLVSSSSGLFRLDGGAEAVRVIDAEVLTGPDRLRLTVAGLASGPASGPASGSGSELVGGCWLESDRQRVAATSAGPGPRGPIIEFALLGEIPFGTGFRPLNSGRFVFQLDRGLVSGRTADRSEGNELISAGIGSILTGRLGERTELDRLSVRIERSGLGEFALRIAAPRAPAESGRFRMLQLAAEFRPGSAGSSGSTGHRALREPLAPAVLFDCFDGRFTGDNPRAIQHELLRRRPDLRSYWVVADHAVSVPERSEPVIWNSRAHFEARARARFVVTNCWLGAEFQARPDQRVLQTWHGTPLKRVGLDRIGVDPSEAYRADLIDQTGQWTWLISQNPYSTEIFTRAYGLEAAGVGLAEIGYPRDDVLSLDADPERIETIRTRLGLASGDRAVLFAPTWRENGRSATSGLDFARLRARLGPNWRILVRGHANTVQTGTAVRAAGVVDVTRYPEITDLFAVADLMITDYSSAMFDFTITGKPMIFFVPDLMGYAQTQRGTYFDLGVDAPGPLVTTTEAVADEIERAADGVPGEYAERYRAWTARFNPFDDGHATERAADLLLADLD